MGAALAQTFPIAKAVFARVDDALGQNLSGLMAEGPIETLTLTENAQPALMANGLAVVAVLEAEFGITIAQADFVAGHSLGEYSALTAAGAFTLEDAARLLKLRGQAMQRAVAPGLGAMASLIGPKVDLDFAEAAARAGAACGVCVVANDNNGGNIVISGDHAGVDAAIAYAKAQGARAIPLSVSAPFHSPLMAPAQIEMAQALSGVTLRAPSVPIIPNVTIEATQDPKAIKDLLIEQVTGRVRWRETILSLGARGAKTFVELGAGTVLTGMSKRMVPEATSLAVSSVADMEALVAHLA
ncbi:MAG: hypothetical protein RL186_619 [Pseudomonadota bacterium]